MNNIDLETYYTPPRKFHFEWVLPLFFKPRSTLKEVVKQENGVWQAPLLILSILVILAMVLAGGPRQTAAQMGSILPPNFEYYTPDQQQQFMDAIAQAQGPLFMVVFPAVSALIGVWLSWFILGSVLHLVMTLSGSRSTTMAALNLTAWASLPFGLRYIVQGIYYAASQSLIRGPGLSGFAAPEATFLAALLALIDIYLIWQVALLLLGARPLSGLARGKAVVAVLVSVVIVLCLQALPGFLSTQLGDLSVIRPFMF